MLLKDCLTDSFGVPFDGTLEIDQDVLSAIVDAIGGIELETSKLDGSKVCDYQYTALPEDSLYSPAERQLMVIRAILDACQSLPQDQLSKLFDTILPLLTTDMEESQLEAYQQELLPLVSSLTIKTQICPDKASAKESEIEGLQHAVLIPDLEKCREMLGTNS